MKFASSSPASARLLCLLGLIGLASHATAASVVTGGHIDAPAFGYPPGEGFEPHIHNEGGADGAIIDGVRETNDVEFEPDELIFRVNFTSTTTVDTVDYYFLPEVQQTAEDNQVPWMGIGFEEIVAAVANNEIPGFVGDTFTISLQVNSAPTGAEFRMWQDDGFGGAIDFINTATNKLSFDIDPFNGEDHIHVNWGFTHEGVYDLEFGITGTPIGGSEESASGVYSFQVVPEPSAALLGALGGVLLLRRRRL